MRFQPYLGLLLPAILASTQTGVPPGYALRTAVALTPARDGLAGRIELFEDGRISPEMRAAVGDAYGADPCGSDQPLPVFRNFCAAPDRLQLRPALLRVVDAADRVVASEREERPLAELAIKQLYGNARATYFVTVDLSVGIGSYAGPLTRLAEIRRGELVWLTARNASPRDSAATAMTGAGAEIALAATLKTDWRLVPRVDGRGTDILMIACRPDLKTESPSGPATFALSFQRFSYERGRWVRHARREAGFWEAEDSAAFPPRDRFP